MRQASLSAFRDRDRRVAGQAGRHDMRMEHPDAVPSLQSEPDAVEVSVVMPCLNEADTVAVCVKKALAGLAAAKAVGEVIVADNGSTDGSRELARQAGARVVDVPGKGYGRALMGGIAAARGQWVIMGDADDSYDFTAIPLFVDKLRQGFDLVMGCRLPGGGGTIAPGAMPVLHRLIGNPLFSFMVKAMFKAPIHDVYCGLRGFSREFYQRLGMRCPGMEFATEMVIKASLFTGRIAEAPITLHPDGRKAHAPHLKTFRDGWRTLRFFLMLSPRWLYLIPGCLLGLLGLLGFALILPGFSLFGVNIEMHSLLVSTLALLLGAQTIQFGILTKLFAIGEGLLPKSPWLTRFLRASTLERLILLGALAFLVGLALIGYAGLIWWRLHFGPLDYAHTMRLVIPGMTLAALGVQTALFGFFLDMLRSKHP